MNLTTYIENIPKAELHVHIEGTLEPEMLLELASRNKIDIPFETIEDLKNAYQFNNLQEFLDIYYQGANVLIKEQDFYDLTYAYLEKLHAQNVKHVEIMFDPQAHTNRGIDLKVVVDGISKAINDGKRIFNLSSFLIFSFLRHLSEEDAIKTLSSAIPFKDRFIAVGLDSSENGHPPKKFKRVFKMAKELGLHRVVHAGEEGPPANVRDAINLLGASRIDHGNSSLQDPDLCHFLSKEQIPLTLCPFSNLALKVINKLEDHPLKRMMDLNLMVTINSDDPAYFGGHLNNNYIMTQKALNLTKKDVTLLAINSFKGSFLNEVQKQEFIDAIETYSQKEVSTLS